MYWIGLLLVLALVVLVFANGGGIGFFVDLPSLIVLIGFTLALIIAGGMWKDLVRAFRLLRQSDIPPARREVERSLASVVFAMRVLAGTGIFGFLSGLVMILAQAEQIGNVAGACAVALVILLYAILLILALMPVAARLKNRLREME